MKPIGPARAAALAAQQAAQQAAEAAAKAAAQAAAQAAQAAQSTGDTTSQAPPPADPPDPGAVQDSFERVGDGALGAFGKLMGDAGGVARQGYGEAASRVSVRGHVDAGGISFDARLRDPFGGTHQAGGALGPGGREGYVASQSQDGQLTGRFEEAKTPDQSRRSFAGTAPGGVSLKLEKTKDGQRGVEKTTYDVDSPSFGFSGGTIKGHKSNPESLRTGGKEGSSSDKGGPGPDTLNNDFYLHVPSPVGGENLLDVEQRGHVSGEVSSSGISMDEGDSATWEGSVDTAASEKAEGVVRVVVGDENDDE